MKKLITEVKRRKSKKRKKRSKRGSNQTSLDFDSWQEMMGRFDPDDFSDIERYLGKQRFEPQKPWISAGGVVLNSQLDPNRVYIIKPSNNYGPWSFPKGRVDEGETQRQAALREVWEETGLVAKILPQGYIGKGRGTMSITHFYMMVRTGGRPTRTKETDETRLVTFDEARRLFKRDGNRRDVKIANLAQAWLAERIR